MQKRYVYTMLFNGTCRRVRVYRGGKLHEFPYRLRDTIRCPKDHRRRGFRLTQSHGRRTKSGGVRSASRRKES